MSNIFKYLDLEQNQGRIAYITRSMLGTWSITYYPCDRYAARSISSYEQLLDEDLAKIADRGLKIFDFKSVSDDKFTELHREHCAFADSIRRR